MQLLSTEMKKLIEAIRPYIVNENGDIDENAPREIKEAAEKLHKLCWQEEQ